MIDFPIDWEVYPAEQYCRVCGCTDDSPCEPGCWWVEEDLCSSCSGRPEPAESPAPPAYIRSRALDEEMDWDIDAPRVWVSIELPRARAREMAAEIVRRLNERSDP